MIEHRKYNTDNLLAEWTDAPWDSKLLGFPVLQINEFSLIGHQKHNDVEGFLACCMEANPGLISIRLPHEKLKETMCLEGFGFRFIEMVHYPYFCDLNTMDFEESDHLKVEHANNDDIDGIKEIASCAFSNERFHVDPRIDSNIADQRYSNWAINAACHSTQELYAIKDKTTLIAFFVIENKPDGICYWHLNGVSPSSQGKGYGEKSWLAMMRLAKKEGAKGIKTCIAARNTKVLNLYAKLGFKFSEPEMTFHWMPE